MSHAIHILKNPPEYTMRYSVQPGRNTKMKCMLIFWEMRDSSMSFMSIIPKPSHHTIHKVYFQEHNSLYPILWVTTRYSYSKRCDTFCQDCTFLEACIPRMHTIELMVHNQNTHHKLTIFTSSEI